MHHTCFRSTKRLTPAEEQKMTISIYAVVDASGEFKRVGRFDTGEFATHHEAESFRASLPDPDDYTVQFFREEPDGAEEARITIAPLDQIQALQAADRLLFRGAYEG